MLNSSLKACRSAVVCLLPAVGRCLVTLALLGCALATGAQTPDAGVVVSTVSGVVTNRTTGKASPGDTVALVGFDRRAAGGMQVVAQTTSDTRGRFSLDVPDSEAHLLRVSHQKAAYFEPLPAGASSRNVDVYDVAPLVAGIATEADVLSMETLPDGSLHVTEDYFVRNSSQPARTQLSDHAYEFYLPQGIKLLGTAAKGPNGLPVDSSPVPLPGQGHYAFIFPLRPGQTRFQVSYSLAYSGKPLGWTQRESLATENLVILLPKTMRFSPGGTEWQPVPADPSAQTYVRKGVAPLLPVAFSVEGQGQLPRRAPDAAPGGGGGNVPGAAPPGGVATRDSMAADTRPGGGLGPPVDTPDPLARYKPWLLGGLAVLLLGGAVWLLRGRSLEGGEPERQPPGLRAALEQALLALEREHAGGQAGAEEYAESRTGLQEALHRTLAREAGEQTSGRVEKG